jgi:hypothetical protein
MKTGGYSEEQIVGRPRLGCPTIDRGLSTAVTL